MSTVWLGYTRWATHSLSRCLQHNPEVEHKFVGLTNGKELKVTKTNNKKLKCCSMLLQLRIMFFTIIICLIETQIYFRVIKYPGIFIGSINFLNKKIKCCCIYEMLDTF